MHKLKVSNGEYTLIDEEDLSRVERFTWHKHYSRENYFLVVTTFKKNGKTKYVILARLIMNAPNGILVDHENRNTLDNRKSNLRFATKGQNVCNANPHNNRKYKGVTFAAGKYQAAIAYQRKDYYLGRFDTAEEAAKAYDKKAVELHGEFARLNFS